MSEDLAFMAMALDLARKGTGLTSPNPLVGAVLVKDGQVAGSGFHEKAGLPHAEVIALEEAGSKARGATLYVNLEPCCHHGRTGPCTHRILSAGVARVVVAMEDPDPRVSGKGILWLKEHGIEVSSGVLEEEAFLLNEPFVKFVLTGMPMVALKWAMTLDGRISTSTGASRWISNESSRKMVHELRACYDAVLVGRNTIERDDPALTVRLCQGRNPRRIVLDSLGRISLDARCLSEEAETIVAVTDRAPLDRVRRLEDKGATVLILRAENGRVDWKSLLHGLVNLGITSILMEGGAEVASSALEAGVVDKVLAFVAPKIIGGVQALGPVGGSGVTLMEGALKMVISSVLMLEGDVLIQAYPQGSPLLEYPKRGEARCLRE